MSLLLGRLPPHLPPGRPSAFWQWPGFPSFPPFSPKGSSLQTLLSPGVLEGDSGSYCGPICNLRSVVWSLSSLKNASGDTSTTPVIYRTWAQHSFSPVCQLVSILVITPIQSCVGWAGILCGFCANVFLCVGICFVSFFLSFWFCF